MRNILRTIQSIGFPIAAVLVGVGSAFASGLHDTSTILALMAFMAAIGDLAGWYRT